ncbi:MAG: hypothetical protein GXO83_00275 [Chlorobi bacterium]|nr:hypothetical protein [Chlorobiota bacterium]
MSIPIIILLIFLGIVLFLIEFLLVPGITVAGIGGGILLIGSIIMAYHYHGATVGNYVLLGTLVLSFITLYFALKSKTWKSIMLKTTVDGKVNVIADEKHNLKPGDTGETVSRLNPIGKVRIDGFFYEAKSLDKYIDQHTMVEVVKVLPSQIIVKPKTT